MTQPARKKRRKPRRPTKGGIKARRHKSSMWMFLGIYVALTFTVAFAVYMLHLTSSSKRNAELASQETAAPIKEPSKPEVTTPKVAPKPKIKKPSPEPAKPKKQDLIAKAPKPDKKKGDKKTSDRNIDIEKQVLEQYPDPKITPLLEIVRNWQNIPQKAIPKIVAIRVPVTFEIKEAGQVVATGKLSIGSTMRVMKLDNGMIQLSSGSGVPVSATLKIEETDLQERIQARYDSFVRKKIALIEEQRSAERERILQSIAKQEALAIYNDGKDPRFNPLKESLRKGDAGATIELEAAVKWKWIGKETIDGVEYDTAYVVIESETAFGINEKEIKCALRDGKVIAWYDVRSGSKL
ncbi:MAG: hypothetical protein L3J39_05615 [Verrucomicrobiales bacterium]|nr:hypothetical protein [Verrucomicrobiales bacterium]